VANPVVVAVDWGDVRWGMIPTLYAVMTQDTAR
jgi:hypothetical protein